MNAKFLYPTKKNFIIFFTLYQIVPILVFTSANPNLMNLIHLEFIGIAILGLWPLKPNNLKDERELYVELKWKNIMLEGTLTLILIPLFFLINKPGIEGWDLFRLFTYPIFLLLILTSLLYKKELGYFNKKFF